MSTTPPPQPHIVPDSLAGQYVELLKRSLTATVHQDLYVARRSYDRSNRWVRRLAAESLLRAVQARNWQLVRRCPRTAVEEGRVWPLVGETMIGHHRLDNLRECIETIAQQQVPGDLIETGVWRGGASIFMRGVLRALDISDRRVWVADSFQGLPEPTGRYPADSGDDHHRHSELAVSLELVQDNFRRYGLLDDQVRFLPGLFADTLPTVKSEQWALIRLDGDMYESTMDALNNLYAQLSPGGFVVVDDGALLPCKAAVDDFRASRGITEPIQDIDWTGFYWQRRRS